MSMDERVADAIFRGYDSALGSVAANATINPDEAAEGARLAADEGLPPGVAMADLKAFKDANKRKLAQEIVRSNPALIEYVNANPIAPQISNDDYGQLDIISETVRKIGDRDVFGLITDGYQRYKKVEKAAILGAIDGYGWESQKQEWNRLINYVDDPVWRAFITQSGFGGAVITLDTFMRTFSGMFAGLAAGAGEIATQVTGSEAWGNRFARDVYQIAQVSTTGIPSAAQAGVVGGRMSRTGLNLPQQVQLFRAKDLIQFTPEQVRDAGTVARNLRPWMEAGVSPPLGLDPILDRAKAEQSKIDVDNLLEATSEAGRSTTRDRDPELFQRFIAQHTDAQIGISAEAVLQLYGGKRPGPDDGLFGWAPAIEQQLALAASYGGDVVVPLSDWLAHVDPAIARDLRDNIRVRPGEPTALEAKFAIDTWHGSPATFDAFDSKYMGSGEGAQAYAYGHYVAENPKVAKEYQTRLGGEKGNLYRTNIKRESSEFLDWEADLADQPAGQKILQGMDPEFKAALEEYLDLHDQSPELDSLTGREFHRLLERFATEGEIPGVTMRDEPHYRREASEYIKSLGVPGVKFLDQQSRGKAEGTRNYVVFDEADIEVLDRNGQPIPGKDWPEGTAPEVQNEAFLGPEPRQVAPMEPVEAVRKSAGLEPLFAIGDRKLKLQPIDQFRYDDKETGGDRVVNTFDIYDEQGNNVGMVDITEQNGGKTLYIENIAADWRLGPSQQIWGPSIIRDLLRQIKETFPAAKELTGFRVSGAREKAGTVQEKGTAGIKFNLDDIDGNFRVPEGWGFIEAMPQPELAPEGLWLKVGGNVDAYVKPSQALTANEAALSQAVTEALDRIVPNKVRVQEGQRLRRKVSEGQTGQSTEPLGAYVTFADAWPVIAWAYEDPGALGTVRHEAIHHLRQYNFFTPQEWTTLRKAAVENKWLEQYNINDRYKGLSVEAKIEEAIADGFKHWYLDGAKVPDAIKPMFERIKEFLNEIKEKVAALLGKENLTWEDIFAKVEVGEIGAREGGAPRVKGAYKESVSNTSDADPAFAKAQAIGMTKQQYDRYQKLITERQKADFDKELKRAQAQQKRIQSDQWKAWEAEERPQAVQDVNERPYVQADKYFREGQLFGQEITPKPRLGIEYLTPDQQNVLPKSWQGKTGFHPDDVAPVFGYPSGADMLAQLEWFVNERNVSKKRPEEYQRLLIDQEIQRRVEAKHGKLEENILDEATDQALSKTQLEILHEEALALASQAGLQFSIDPVAFETAIKDAFAEQRMAGVSSERVMTAVSKAGKAAEMGLLTGKPAEAFRAKQQQYMAMVVAREARQLEKDQAAVEKLAKRYSSREVKGSEQEAVNFVQLLLSQAGYRVRLTPDEIAANIAFTGYADLPDFVASKAADGWEPAVSQQLQAAGAKPLEQMTVADFREFKDAVDSLAYIGREMNKIEVAGQKQDMADFRAVVKANLEMLPVRPRNHNSWFYRFDAALTRPEEILKDLDLRKEAGPMWEAVFVPLAKSKAKEFDMLTELSKHFQETKGAFSKSWRKSLDETVQQDFLYDPYLSTPGNLVKMDLNREQLLNMMLNWGNKDNRRKLAGGFAMVENNGKRPTKDDIASMEARMKALIDQNARPEDWEFVKRMVQPFRDWAPQIEQVSRNVSGVAPKMVDVREPVQTAYGDIDGWYWPVKYDKYGSNMQVVQERQPNTQGAFGPQYLRAATAQSYLKERTGYIDVVDITTSVEQAAGTMQQTIHDIAFRDSIMQAGKILYDKELRRAFDKHYGKEYTEQFDPWLKRVANQYSVMERDGLSSLRDFMRRARINLIGHALPANLKVILSPDIGTPNPAAWARFEANRSQNMKFAMERSNEIRHLVYNMDRDFREQLERVTARGGFDAYRAKAVEWGFWPVMKMSQEFRMSTFIDQYQKARAKGMDDVQAVEVADGYVRSRHGAASSVDLPAIMNSNEFMKSLTMFYGFFNTMYNWQRQIPGNIRRREWKDAAVNAAGSIGVGAAFGALLFNQQKEDDSWWKIIGKALLMQPLSTVPGLREGSSLFFEGYPARTPMESIMNAMRTLYNDIMRKRQGRPMKNPVKNTANVVGMLTGLPFGQTGRTGEFLYDLSTGQQPRPRNIMEWFRGIVHGEARLK